MFHYFHGREHASFRIICLCLVAVTAQILKVGWSIKVAEGHKLPFGSFRLRRLGASVGIASPLLAFACILVAIASYPQFSWTNDALSDLGVVKGLTGSLFNFGLYSSGFLACIFTVFGLLAYIGKSAVGKAGSLVFAAATVMLIAIGVFNEDFSGTHFAVSVGFFVLVPISLFILTYAFALEHQTRTAAFTASVGIVAAGPWILQFALHYVPNVAVPETISGLAVSAWIVAVSYGISKQAKN